MNTYEYLNQLRQIDYKIKNAKSELERLETLATTASAIDYTRESIQNGKAEQEPAFVRTLDQIADKVARLDEMLTSYECIREKIYNQVNNLPNAQQSRVLYLRFFEFKTLEKISCELNYSFYGVRAIYRGGLRSFRRIYGEEFEE